MKRGICFAGLTLAALGFVHPANAGFGDLIPSTRWLVLSSPFSPQTYDECETLRQEFEAEIDELSVQHDYCLEGASGDEAGSSCTRITCQPLHSARDSARSRANDETATCRQRVNVFMEEQRAEEKRRRERAEAAERERREQVAEEAAERAERDRAEQEERLAEEERERQRAVDEAREEWERAAREAEDARERAAQAARQEQERHDEELARNEEQAQRETQYARDAAERQASADRLLNALLAQERAAEESRRAASERQAIDRLNQLNDGLREDPKQAADAADIVITLGANPFRQPLVELLDGPLGRAAEARATEANETLLEKGLDLATDGFSAAALDPAYDELATDVDTAHDRALEANPFAKAVSGLALSGVQHMQRKAIGEMTELAGQIDGVGDSDQVESPKPAILRSSPQQASSSAGDTALSVGPIGSLPNPFAKPATMPAAVDRTSVVVGAGATPQDDRDNPFRTRIAMQQPSGMVSAPIGTAVNSSLMDSIPPAALSPDQIRQVQEELQSAGFSPGPADGKVGRKTRQALRAYQMMQGLTLSGELDLPTLVALGIK